VTGKVKFGQFSWARIPTTTLPGVDIGRPTFRPPSNVTYLAGNKRQLRSAPRGSPTNNIVENYFRRSGGSRRGGGDARTMMPRDELPAATHASREDCETFRTPPLMPKERFVYRTRERKAA